MNTIKIKRRRPRRVARGGAVSRTATDMPAAVERAKSRLRAAFDGVRARDPDAFAPASRNNPDILGRVVLAFEALPDLRLWRGLAPESAHVIRDALRFEGLTIEDVEGLRR